MEIQDDNLGKIWLPYNKADTSRGKTKGIGLGLTIVKVILELHKFSYGAKNSENGVTFWFKFQ